VTRFSGFLGSQNPYIWPLTDIGRHGLKTPACWYFASSCLTHPATGFDVRTLGLQNRSSNLPPRIDNNVSRLGDVFGAAAGIGFENALVSSPFWLVVLPSPLHQSMSIKVLRVLAFLCSFFEIQAEAVATSYHLGLIFLISRIHCAILSGSAPEYGLRRRGWVRVELKRCHSMAKSISRFSVVHGISSRDRPIATRAGDV